MALTFENVWQPTESFLSRGTHETTSTIEDFAHNEPLIYCQTGIEEVKIALFVSTSKILDAPSDVPSLHKTVTVTCLPCLAGWTRKEMEGVWTCVPCNKNQYVVDPNKHACESCPAGANCEDGIFTPSNPADSVWETTAKGVMRLKMCPPGFVLVRDETQSVLDQCIACSPDSYSMEKAIYGQQMWNRSVENYNQYCHPCPR